MAGDKQTDATDALRARAEKVLLPTYTRYPLALARGDGARVWDADGKEYLDFLAGLAVTNLGHCHPAVTAALEKQAHTLWHVSNLFHMENQITLAEKLCAQSFADRAFFCNSGTEAVEAALKLARRAGPARGRDGGEVITMQGGFHGRTLGALAATGQEKIHQGFYPLLEGFTYVPYDDVGAVDKAITKKTAAVLVEPIQGEGGVVVPHDGYLHELRALCDTHNLLLIVDEVQTGLGRTGTLFAYAHEEVRPDAMTLAKALGNGFPIGALLTTEECAAYLNAGSHASTFGGNPLATAVGCAVIDALVEDVLVTLPDKAASIESALAGMATDSAVVESYRGRGMMWALVLNTDGTPFMERARERGLLLNCTQGSILRLLPPLTITDGDLHEGLDILRSIVMD